jgi:hypothetical protein
MLVLKSADVLCYRIYDVSDGIDLEACRKLVEAGGSGIRRLALKREGSEYIQLSVPPLNVELGLRSLVLRNGSHQVRVSTRIFHHGAISFSLRVALPSGASIDSLIPFVDELYDSPAVEALAAEELQKLRKLLEPAFEKPHEWEQNEGYTVILVREIEGRPTAEQVLEEPSLARLLLGELNEAELSTGEKTEVLGYHYSYTPYDLAIIEWNAAFLYEPSGSEDIPDLLEIANAQLLELRYYDGVLDSELSRVYDVIEKKQSGSLIFSPFKKLLRGLMLTVIELSEFIERIENALKIVGDVYLARVYEGAVKQLRVTRWTEQVTRKHRLLQQTYALLKGEVDTGRALTLEAMVVILILFEILMAFSPLGHR